MRASEEILIEKPAREVTKKDCGAGHNFWMTAKLRGQTDGL